MRSAGSAFTSALALATLAYTVSGCGGSSSSGGGGISAVPATTSGAFMQPRDSVPSSDGTLFYFTALTSGGVPAVFKVPASGGQASLIASGAPLSAPNSLAISSDDKTLFVTDGGGSGQIYIVPTAGGAATALVGTSGTAPYGVEVRRSGGDLIYFSGKSASSGKPGVFTISPTGGTVGTVLEGSPLTSPGGVTVANNGDVYVVNIEGPGQDGGCIYKIASGAATQLACGLRFGTPSGITLDLAETLVLASGIDATGHDQVYAISLATKTVSTVNDDISQNTRGGGVHRARSVDVFSWADLSAGSAGTVYRVTFK